MYVRSHQYHVRQVDLREIVSKFAQAGSGTLHLALSLLDVTKDSRPLEAFQVFLAPPPPTPLILFHVQLL